MITQPVWESGVFLEAKEASEKARNRRSLTLRGWLLSTHHCVALPHEGLD